MATAASAASSDGSSTTCGGRRRVERRADHKGELGLTTGALQGEHPVTVQAAAGRDARPQQRDKALVPARSVGQGIERLAGAFVLGGHPGRRCPASRPPRATGTGPARRRRGGRRRRRRGGRAAPGRPRCGAGQPLPMFGRLPWFALLRRMRAFFFLVFFDMRYHPTRVRTPSYQAVRPGDGRRRPVLIRSARPVTTASTASTNAVVAGSSGTAVMSRHRAQATSGTPPAPLARRRAGGRGRPAARRLRR